MNLNTRAAWLIGLMLTAPLGMAASTNYAVGKYVVLDIPGATQTVTPAIGIAAGLRLDQRYAFEFDAEYGLQGSNGLFPSLWTFGSYMAYRELLSRHWFWKARGGAALSRYVDNHTGDGLSHGSLSAGAGAGVVLRLSHTASMVAEAEFTWLGGERTSTSVGLSWPF